MGSQNQTYSLLDQLQRSLVELKNLEARRQEVRAALLDTEEKYRIFLNNCTDALFLYRVFEDGRPGPFLEVNEAACRQLGYSREELLGMTISDVTLPPSIRDFLTELFRNKRLITESLHIAKGGEHIPVEVSCQLFPIDDKPAVLITARDLRERKKAEEALRESQAHFHALFETTFDAIFIYDDEGTLLDLNPSCAKMYGYERKEIIGTSVMRFISEKDRNRTWEGDVRGMIRKPYETLGVKKDGSLFDIELFGQRIDYRGQSVRVTVARDITEKKRAEAAIHFQATHDCLTGLPNRSLFFDRLNQALAQATRTETAVAVQFVDLDSFKDANDRYGHSFGDALLKAVARRLLACCRRSDTVARLGGDEFAVVQCNLAAGRAASGHARKMLRALAEPFSIEGETAQVSASIGIALFPSDASNPDDLVNCADKAMYGIKNEGGNRLAFYQTAKQTRLTISKRRSA